jgi:hypothetical protein
MRTPIAACLVVLLMALPVSLVGQTAAAGSATIDAALKQRVLEYWQRRQAKDLSNAYPYYCAEYRARVPLAQFLQQTRLVRFDLTGVQVAGAEPDGRRMNVKISYRFLVPSLPQPEQSGQTTEPWMRGADGKWCKEDEVMVLPFPVASPNSPKP